MSDAFQQVEELLIHACNELFDGQAFSVDVNVDRKTEGNAAFEDCIIAMIGFGSTDGSRGSVMLATSRETAAGLIPEELDDKSELASCDVLGEFANMLVGRLKNLLLPRGVTLLLGTPTTGLVWKLRLSPPANAYTWVDFDVSGLGDIRLRFDVTLSEGLELCAPQESAGPAISEGDMMLF